MSLKERLEGKQRRWLMVPILVSDPSEDQAALSALLVALNAAAGRDDAGAVAQLQPQAEAHADKVRSHWVEVKLLSLPADEWRVATSVWQTVEVSDDGPEVVTNWAEALAPLLAESCADPELQDAEWWAGQLQQPGWSEGDRNALKLALLRLNVEAADPQIPKG
jgi:hypothetical protein